MKSKATGITYFHSAFRRRDFSCPICGNNQCKKALQVVFENAPLQMFKCECGSLFFPGRRAPDYGIVESHDSFWMRIDQAEGIDSTIRPLFLSSEFISYPVVDIGCGMGFSSDFVRYQNRACVSFDPSAAAVMSTELLGIEIIHDFANPELIDLDQPLLVYASEVIEHVDDPRAFISMIKQIAGDKGYAVLTTPNADYISKGAPPSVVNAMLGPSQHLFLFSKLALQNLCRSVGFNWCRVIEANERLFVVCGPEEVPIIDAFDRPDYISYLESRLANNKVDSLIRIRSFGYRLFKELVHSARYVEAESILIQIETAYNDLGFELKNPEQVVGRFRKQLDKGMSLPPTEKYPFNLAIIMYLMGTLKLAHNQDREYAFRYFRAAISLSNMYKSVFAVNSIFASYDLEIQSVADWSMNSMRLHGARGSRKVLKSAAGQLSKRNLLKNMLDWFSR